MIPVMPFNSEKYQNKRYLRYTEKIKRNEGKYVIQTKFIHIIKGLFIQQQILDDRD